MRYYWQISEATSYIEFSLKFYEIGRIKGYFKKFEGEILAGNNFEHPGINLKLWTNSISTFNDEWDNMLMSSAFIDHIEFPYITFRSGSGCHLSIGGIQELTGDLQIRDRINHVTLLVTSAVINKMGKEPGAHFCLTTTLPLMDFGFDNKENIFGHEVNLSVRLALNKSGS
jgi:polyisoprenoid-binding protein YceI